jgi:hypothetical protein
MQPEPVRDRPEGAAAGQLEKRLAEEVGHARPGTEPGARLAPRARRARRALRPLPEPPPHEVVEGPGPKGRSNFAHWFSSFVSNQP